MGQESRTGFDFSGWFLVAKGALCGRRAGNTVSGVHVGHGKDGGALDRTQVLLALLLGSASRLDVQKFAGSLTSDSPVLLVSCNFVSQVTFAKC